MLNLEPHEFFAGTLADAEAGTLQLPRTNRETYAYVGKNGEKDFAVLLSGNYIYQSIDAGMGENWTGILVPKTKIIVDPESTIDPRSIDPRPGMIIRLLDKLSVWAYRNNRMSHDMIRVDLATSLPPCSSDLQVGFLHWQIVLDNERERRVLLDVDLRDHIKGSDSNSE